MNHPLSQTWETYVAAWKTASPAERQALFAQSLDPECVYNDPNAQTCGWRALIAYMDAFHQQVPGGYFQTKTFEAHHQQSLVTWNMMDGKGQVIGDGTSYGKYNDDGKLVAMTGFFAVA